MSYPQHSNNQLIFDYANAGSLGARNNMVQPTMPTHSLRPSADASQPGPARYKEYERKREGFRRYLEQYGVLDMITNVLTSMHDSIDWASTTPPNGLDVFRQILLKDIDGHLPEEREIWHMQRELLELQKANKMMQEEVHLFHEQQRKLAMGQLETQFEQLDVPSSSSNFPQQQQPAMYATSSIPINSNGSSNSTSTASGSLASPPMATHKNQTLKLTPPSNTRT